MPILTHFEIPTMFFYIPSKHNIYCMYIEIIKRVLISYIQTCCIMTTIIVAPFNNFCVCFFSESLGRITDHSMLIDKIRCVLRSAAAGLCN